MILHVQVATYPAGTLRTEISKYQSILSTLYFLGLHRYHEHEEVAGAPPRCNRQGILQRIARLLICRSTNA